MYYGRPLESENGWFGQVNYQNRAGLATYTALDKNESFGSLRGVAGYQGRLMYASVAINYSMGNYYWGQSDLSPEWTGYQNYGAGFEYGFSPLSFLNSKLEWRPVFVGLRTSNEVGSYHNKIAELSYTPSSDPAYDYLVEYNEYRASSDASYIGTEFKYLHNEQWVAGLEFRFDYENVFITPSLEYNRFGLYCMVELGGDLYPTIGTYYRF